MNWGKAFPTGTIGLQQNRKKSDKAYQKYGSSKRFTKLL